jgi:hypothetical protein
MNFLTDNLAQLVAKIPPDAVLVIFAKNQKKNDQQRTISV